MRFVSERVISEGVGRLRAGNTTSGVKEYFERVAKYVPAEIIAAYISANGVATVSRNPGVLLGLIFAVCLVCTPLYVTRFTVTKREGWMNSVMAALAFVVWAYATGGGLFKYIEWYDGPTASVLLILFSLGSGMFEPRAMQNPPPPELKQP